IATARHEWLQLRPCGDERGRCRTAGKGLPQVYVATLYEIQWRALDRSRLAIAFARPQQTPPADLTADAKLVEPCRIVVRQARRQNVAFPGRGRCGDAVELLQ